MRAPPRILIADDQPMNVDILQTRLAVHGYEILTATDGEEALAMARAQLPDLILLDIMMPKMDGIEVCRLLKADAALPFMPIIMVTAKADTKDIVAGPGGGGRRIPDQAGRSSGPGGPGASRCCASKRSTTPCRSKPRGLRAQSLQLAEWNRTLEQRVADQLAELERIGRLKRFFSPQLAELIVSTGEDQPVGEPPARGHRRLLRSARVHRLLRDHRTRGGHGGSAGVPYVAW